MADLWPYIGPSVGILVGILIGALWSFDRWSCRLGPMQVVLAHRNRSGHHHLCGSLYIGNSRALHWRCRDRTFIYERANA